MAGTSASQPLDFPKFDGSGPFYWLFRAEQFFASSDTLEDQRIAIAAANMDGSAESWFQTMQKQQAFTSWSGLSKAVEDHFVWSRLDRVFAASSTVVTALMTDGETKLVNVVDDDGVEDVLEVERAPSHDRILLVGNADEETTHCISSVCLKETQRNWLKVSSSVDESEMKFDANNQSKFDDNFKEEDRFSKFFNVVDSTGVGGSNTDQHRANITLLELVSTYPCEMECAKRDVNIILFDPGGETKNSPRTLPISLSFSNCKFHFLHNVYYSAVPFKCLIKCCFWLVELHIDPFSRYGTQVPMNALYVFLLLLEIGQFCIKDIYGGYVVEIFDPGGTLFFEYCIPNGQPYCYTLAIIHLADMPTTDHDGLFEWHVKTFGHNRVFFLLGCKYDFMLELIFFSQVQLPIWNIIMALIMELFTMSAEIGLALISLDCIHWVYCCNLHTWVYLDTIQIYQQHYYFWPNQFERADHGYLVPIDDTNSGVPCTYNCCPSKKKHWTKHFPQLSLHAEGTLHFPVMCFGYHYQLVTFGFLVVVSGEAQERSNAISTFISMSLVLEGTNNNEGIDFMKWTEIDDYFFEVFPVPNVGSTSYCVERLHIVNIGEAIPGIVKEANGNEKLLLFPFDPGGSLLDDNQNNLINFLAATNSTYWLLTSSIVTDTDIFFFFPILVDLILLLCLRWCLPSSLFNLEDKVDFVGGNNDTNDVAVGESA